MLTPTVWPEKGMWEFSSPQEGPLSCWANVVWGPGRGVDNRRRCSRVSNGWPRPGETREHRVTGRPDSPHQSQKHNSQLSQLPWNLHNLQEEREFLDWFTRHRNIQCLSRRKWMTEFTRLSFCLSGGNRYFQATLDSVLFFFKSHLFTLAYVNVKCYTRCKLSGMREIVFDGNKVNHSIHSIGMILRAFWS